MLFFFVFPAAVAEVRDSLGAPRLPVLPGLGDGSGRDGRFPNVSDQPLRTERIHAKMGSPLLLTPDHVTFTLMCPVTLIPQLKDPDRERMLLTH